MDRDENLRWSDLLTRARVEKLPSEITLFLDQLEAKLPLPEELIWEDGDDRLAEWLMSAVTAGYLKLEPYNKLRESLGLQQELPKLHLTEAAQ